MLQQDEPDDYVIGTGHTCSVRDLCDAAFGASASTTKNTSMQDPRFFRPAEVDLLVADPSKAREELGWEPTVTFDELVRDDGGRGPRAARGARAEMRALVTGGGGFVGQWLARALLERGDDVDARGAWRRVRRPAGARRPTSARRRAGSRPTCATADDVDAAIERARARRRVSPGRRELSAGRRARRRRRVRRQHARRGAPARRRSRAACARASWIRWCSSSAAAMQYGPHDAVGDAAATRPPSSGR